MSLIKTENVKACYNEKFCFAGCLDYKRGICPGPKLILIGNDDTIICKVPWFNEYYDNYFKDLEMEIKKEGYITKQEVLDITKERYGIDLTPRNLSFYVSQGLIKPGIMERIPGISGSISFFKDDTPGIIRLIYMIKEPNTTFSLKDLKRYFDVLRFKDIEYFKILRNYAEGVNKIGKIINTKIKENIDSELIVELLGVNHNVLESLKNILNDIEKGQSVPLSSFINATKIRAYYILLDKGMLDDIITSLHKRIKWMSNVFFSSYSDDIEKLSIKVVFPKPINKTVIFKKESIEIINN